MYKFLTRSEIDVYKLRGLRKKMKNGQDVII